jgi:hypothetical protein
MVFGAAFGTSVLLPEPICNVTDPLFFVVHDYPADQGDGQAVGKPTHQRKSGSLVPLKLVLGTVLLQAPRGLFALHFSRTLFLARAPGT